jgi:hypothetical protein
MQSQHAFQRHDQLISTARREVDVTNSRIPGHVDVTAMSGFPSPEVPHDRGLGMHP